MRQDDLYLLDMLVAARKAARFAADVTYSQFEGSDLHQNAIIKVVEIVGEAASRVSEVTKEAHPEVPWQEIVGLRNRIVHAYFEIDLELIWQIVHEDVPVLIDRLEQMVPPEAK